MFYCSNCGALERVQSFAYKYTFLLEVFTKITMLQFLKFMIILRKHRRFPCNIIMDKNLIYIDPDYNSGALEGVQLIQAMFLQKNDVQSVFTKQIL